MYRRLMPFSGYFSLPLHHPERLPTFTGLVLGFAALLLGLSSIAGASLWVLLVPVLLVCCTLLPWSSLVLAVGVSLTIALLAWFPALHHINLREVAVLAMVVLLSPWIRRELLRREWQWTTEKTLASLIENDTAESADQSIARSLTTLKEMLVADAAIVLRQLDNVTAEVLLASPTTALPSRLTTPALFMEAIEQNRCLFYPNYGALPHAAPTLRGQGVKSLAVMPLHQLNEVQGAILLLWYRPVRFSGSLQHYLESLRSGLSHLLRFQDVTLRLEKLQARLVAILETIPQGIAFVDEGGEQGWLNHTAATQLNLPQGAITPMSLAQAMAALRRQADNQQELNSQAAHFFAQSQVEIRNWEWYFSNPTKVLSLSSTPTQVRQVPGRLWVLDDITEQKQAETALRLSEERFQLIARATNDAVWDWDLHTGEVWWSEGIETLFGYSDAQVGKDIQWWYDQLHADDRERIITEIQQAIEQGKQFWTHEYRFHKANGTYACVVDRSYLIHTSDGTPLRILGGMTDVTERKQFQEELQRQNLRAQLFAEVTLKIRQSLQLQDILQTTVSEVQKMLNADRVLVYRIWANGTGSGIAEEVVPGFPTVLGYTFPDEVFPETYRQLYLEGRIQALADIEESPEVAPCLVEFVRQFQVKAKLVVPIIAQGELWGLLITHQCDRPRQWTSFEIELLKQLADQIGIALTQAQLLEQETRQREELSRSNTELQQFAYIASHDLQEPLRMVTSYLQLLQRRYQDKLDSNADEFIGFAVDGAARMKRLINDLLAYSRVGTHGKAFERVDCNTIVQRAIDNLKIAITESNATITYDALPEVMGDASQLLQLFQNLIGNAIKFHGTEPPLVHIHAAPLVEAWQFSVQDNGIGIEAQYAERIFVIFQRLHRQSDYPGTGIGLAVCKKIVERHGGQIWMESQPEEGATFYFTLPRLLDT